MFRNVNQNSLRQDGWWKTPPCAWLIQSLGKSFSWLPLGGFGRIIRRMSEFRRKNFRFVQNRPPDMAKARVRRFDRTVFTGQIYAGALQPACSALDEPPPIPPFFSKHDIRFLKRTSRADLIGGHRQFSDDWEGVKIVHKVFGSLYHFFVLHDIHCRKLITL